MCKFNTLKFLTLITGCRHCMKFFLKKKILLVILLLAVGLVAFKMLSRPEKVDFSADVKPIINSKCISCHGGVKAKAGFSLLFREEALAKTESGQPAIIPGDANASEMIKRITHSDPEERMPYRHEPLSKKEISILKRWIDEGANWGDHWAYLPVEKTSLPDVSDSWVRNDIDKFILDKLNDEGIKPNSDAPKPDLLRRVSLDLTGVLPNKELAQKFLNDQSSAAYEVLVDSLLASERFGERWASVWLDLARYADTKGYESDQGRTIWQYRDWVIRAFNKDMPYDKFLTEQIAGDLNPNPTDEQFIATAFHRNTMTNDEGGTDNEEFRTAAVMDRVNTTWEAIMGTTFACVQCHSHPYDPFRHDEYYKFMAYFNNTRDEDVGGEYPALRQFDDTLKEELHQVINWVKEAGDDSKAKHISTMLKTWQPAFNSNYSDSLQNAVRINNNDILLIRRDATARLKSIDLEDVDLMVFNFYSNKKGGELSVHRGSPDGPLLATTRINGMDKWQYVSVKLPVQKGIADIYIKYRNNSIKPADDAMVVNWFSFTQDLPGKEKPGYAKMHDQYWKLLTADVPATPIMMENGREKRRKTFVFDRGNWRSPSKEVEPAVPNTLAFAMPANAPKNRAGLSMWLTDKRNPLVSRTLVNRLWEQLFGAGIVETLEDMGTQGMTPTHKELLDHLSYKLMHDHNWSVKSLLKEMVMSSTYRQDSKVSDELKEKDLFNKLYARGPRVRLSGEQIRDQHLCISGLMNEEMYGPGIMPWQPDGIWLSPYNGARWKTDTNGNQYRRALYTYWKRTSPYPSMLAFDGAQRNVCAARRIRTNTPLQALVTLNDSAYVDMARHFAWRMKKEAKVNDPAKLISTGYELMLFKPITERRKSALIELYAKAFSEFSRDGSGINDMVGFDKTNNTASDAALVVVANAMLNLDEVVMK